MSIRQGNNIIAGAGGGNVNNATITITQGGETKGSFTLNQAADETIALDAGGGGGAVNSVNGKTGVVVLDASDVGALPDSTSIPTESTVSGWGFTKNKGTVTSVNNVQPTNGNVTLNIPTVNDSTITVTQGGVTKGTFTLNQASASTITLDAGTTATDEIIDYQEPTAQNNYTWYRKYRSGWIEQGGYGTTTHNNSAVITLPVPMSTSNYNISATSNDNGDGSVFHSPIYGVQSATGFYITLICGGNAYAGGFYWEVKGMAANDFIEIESAINVYCYGDHMNSTNEGAPSIVVVIPANEILMVGSSFSTTVHETEGLIADTTDEIVVTQINPNGNSFTVSGTQTITTSGGTLTDSLGTLTITLGA